MDTVFVQEAITKSSQAAVKFQLSDAQSPAAAVQEFMNEIEHVLANSSVNAHEYLSQLKGKAAIQSAVPPVSDRLVDRRGEFFNALRKAIEDRLKAL